MKRYVVKSDYGYWQNTGYCKITTDIEHCDKFRTRVCVFLFYLDQIFNGSKVVSYAEK